MSTLFFSNYWFIYNFRVSSWKMIYLFCSLCVSKWSLPLLKCLSAESCLHWKSERWMKLLDKSGQNKKINNHPGPKSEVLNYMCSFYTVTLTLFEILIFFSFFSFLATQTKFLALKESASQREQSVPLPQQQCHQYSVCLGTKGKYHTSCSCMYAFQPHPLLFIWCISILLTFPFSSSQFSS